MGIGLSKSFIIFLVISNSSWLVYQKLLEWNCINIKLCCSKNYLENFKMMEKQLSEKLIEFFVRTSRRSFF